MIVDQSRPGSHLVEDFDRDGDPDGISVVEGGITVLVNYQDGRLVPGDMVPVPGAGFTALTLPAAAFHLPGDDLLDLLVVTETGNHVLASVDGRSFVPVGEVDVPPSAFPKWGSGDIDGDGRRDLLVLRQLLSVEVVQFDAAFAPTHVTLATLPTPQWSITGADVDGDGDQDVLHSTSSSGSRSFRAVLNQGSAGWLVGPVVNVVGAASAASVDGDPELEILARTSGEVIAYEWAGGMLGASTTLFAVAPSIVSLPTPQVLDVDQDGLPDIVGAENSTVHFQTAPQQFEAVRHLPVAGVAHLTPAFGAPLPSLLFAAYAGSAVLPQTAPRVFTSLPDLDLGSGTIRQIFRTPLVAMGPDHMFVTVQETSTSSTLVRVALEAGRFQVVSTANFVGNGNATIIPGEFSGDTNTDLLLLLNAGPTLLRGDGTGAFENVGLLDLPGVGSLLFGVDLDQDGDVDLVEPLAARLWLNLGATGFVARPGPDFVTAAGGLTYIARLQAADQNGDGVLDLAWRLPVGGVPGFLAYGRAGAEPTFDPPIPMGVQTGMTPGGPTFDFDMDEDGDLDFLDFQAPMWMRNDGTGRAMGDPQVLPARFSEGSRQAVDLDGDRGGMEIIRRDFGRLELWRVENEQPILVTDNVGLPGNMNFLVMPDLDGDELADVVAYFGSRLFFLRNSGAVAPGRRR